jgi:hypothetical protein
MEEFMFKSIEEDAGVGAGVILALLGVGAAGTPVIRRRALQPVAG